MRQLAKASFAAAQNAFGAIKIRIVRIGKRREKDRPSSGRVGLGRKTICCWVARTRHCF